MLNKNALSFTVLLSALVAIPPLSTDVGLPAYAATARALGTSQPTVALTLSLFMLGFAIGPLFYGPASERFGRKPVLLTGLGLYLLTSLICTLSPSIWLLLGCRLLQGFAAAAGTVLVVACIRDLFDGITGRKKISYVMMINGLMPLTAPSIGVVILALGDWRAIYATMTLCGLLLFLGVWFGFAESIARKNPQALAFHQLIASYKKVLTHPVGIRASLLNATCFGVMFAFISGSPILFIKLMHLSSQTFGVLFALPVSGTIAGTLCNSLLSSRIKQPRHLLRAGVLLILLASSGLVLLALLAPEQLALMIALFILSNFGIGMVGPNASYTAVQFQPELAGVASAILASSQMIVGAISSALVAALFSILGSATVASVMLGFALLATWLYLSLPPAPAQTAPHGN
jgi:DHA1 family bicyclomycin/chloramphenicol resistance-like MFS transporter